jgi:cytochrome oxidase assembly protein ShyY1
VSFLFTRRWLLFALAVVVMALGAWRLGVWQFDRLHERQQRNEWVRTNLAADPAPVDNVMSVGDDVDPDQEWLQVRASGTYDAQDTVVVRYQTREGHSGVDLVTPLLTDGGTTLLVDRGWVASDNTGADAADLPAPPSGHVEVLGWVRADATGRGIEVVDGSTRAVSSKEIGAWLDRPVYRGYLDAEKETPAPAVAPEPVELPDLGDGPHFFYGLQWWFFGLLAVGGFGYLVRDELRTKRDEEEPDDAGSEPSPATERT